LMCLLPLTPLSRLRGTQRRAAQAALSLQLCGMQLLLLRVQVLGFSMLGAGVVLPARHPHTGLAVAQWIQILGFQLLLLHQQQGQQGQGRSHLLQQRLPALVPAAAAAA